MKWILEGFTVWENPEETLWEGKHLPRGTVGLGREEPWTRRNTWGAFWRLRHRTLQRRHQIRSFGVKAQLDLIMLSWDLKIFE